MAIESYFYFSLNLTTLYGPLVLCNAVDFFFMFDPSYTSCLQEILTMKSGAVQNSPPDKTQHEPGPWSPVGSSFGS